MFCNFSILFSIFILNVADSKQADDVKEKSYANYQLWHIITGKKELSDEFKYRIYQEDVWQSTLASFDVLLNPNSTSFWDEFLKSQNFTYRIITKNVEEPIELWNRNNTNGRRGGESSWTSYPKSLKEIYTFLDRIVASNKKDCSLSVIGKTMHNRDIKMLKISSGTGEKPSILIVGGMHAREWTSIVSVLFFIDTIATNFSNIPSYMTDNNWYIIPVLNPDGYEYSLKKDRYWAKNRRHFSGKCDGVDINRNFDYNWCQGGAVDMCSPRYCGVNAFSEAESKAIKDIITEGYITAFISVHSYGEKILFPWAIRREPTRDIKDHIHVSKEMADAIYAIDKHRYKTGSIAHSGLETGSGTAIDWVYSQGVTLSFVMQTRGETVKGFGLDSKQLNLAVKEITAGIVRLASLI